MAEKSKTNIGEVNNPAPASAIAIIGMTLKYKKMAITMKSVLTRTGFQRLGITERPSSLPRIATMKTAKRDRLKWN
jgi:hypothetical protein